MNHTDSIYFEEIEKYFEKYNALPTKDALDIQFDSMKTLAQDEFDSLLKATEEFEKDKASPVNQTWLLEKTEQFCQDQSLLLALQEAVSISKGENKNLSTTAIPDILSKALAVSFDTNLGHDYFADHKERFLSYSLKVDKIPFHLDTFNKATSGGAERGTVNCVAAGTGVGKSHFLTDLAANYVMNGYNVLYITMELSEKKIGQRIDANLMNLPMLDVTTQAETAWDSNIAKLRAKTVGTFKVKQYANGTAHIGHFKHLLREYKQKYSFVPDIIMVDYLNICASSRIKDRSNMYTYVKSISEELRALAVEANVVLWTATQLNRDGIDNTDADIKNISESMGGPHTFDFLFALLAPEQLLALGQVCVKQLKTRYADLGQQVKFHIGIDRAKMRFYDLQNSTPSSSPVITGSAGSAKPPFGKTPIKKNFSNIKT